MAPQPDVAIKPINKDSAKKTNGENDKDDYEDGDEDDDEEDDIDEEGEDSDEDASNPDKLDPKVKLMDKAAPETAGVVVAADDDGQD